MQRADDYRSSATPKLGRASPSKQEATTVQRYDIPDAAWKLIGDL